MARATILAICQSGGEFMVNSDGSMSYFGGEAHALEVSREMSLKDFRLELSVMFNCNSDALSIKYFLPSNKKTLITVSNDVDLQRMVDFNFSSTTTDVFLLKVENSQFNRAIRSVVADSDTPAPAVTADMAALLEGSKRLKTSASGWESMITGVGQIFDGPRPFRDALHKYAIAHSFTYKFMKNDANRVTAVCSSEGCPWRIHASKASSMKEFRVKKLNDTHTCGKEIGKEGHRLTSQRWVASVIKEKLRESPNYKPRDIMSDLQREYGISLNYVQAWRGKFVAEKELQNSNEEACNQLPWFCHRIMETNPGSVATFETIGDSHFKLFIAFHACLSGFEHGCRPLLFLDGISLKVNKQWKLLAATAVDGENDIFPVSFSVVETESYENWHWFLVQLRSAFSVMPCALTFISNRQNGLEEAVSNVFEDSFHGYCVDTLIEQFKGRIDDSWEEDQKAMAVDALKLAVDTCKDDDFNRYVETIKMQSEELADWVWISRPELWSNAFFKGVRYGRYSSNAKETLESWISTRSELTVVQIVDMIRCKMMETMYTRRASLNSWAEPLTPSMNQRVNEELNKARDLNIVSRAGSIFEVRDELINVVNIETSECTCQRWQAMGMPCMHAAAVIEHVDGCIYDFCSKFFTSECYRLTYLSSISPIPDSGKPLCIDSSHPTVTCPTRTRRLSGRPRKRQADSRLMVKRPLRCSLCKAYGHNKQTCKATL